MTPAGEARFTEGSRVILHGLRANEIFNNRRWEIGDLHGQHVELIR